MLSPEKIKEFKNDDVWERIIDDIDIRALRTTNFEHKYIYQSCIDIVKKHRELIGKEEDEE